MFVGVWNFILQWHVIIIILHTGFLPFIYTFVKLLQLIIVSSIICYFQLLIIRIIEIVKNLCASVI